MIMRGFLWMAGSLKWRSCIQRTDKKSFYFYCIGWVIRHKWIFWSHINTKTQSCHRISQHINYKVILIHATVRGKQKTISRSRGQDIEIENSFRVVPVWKASSTVLIRVSRFAVTEIWVYSVLYLCMRFTNALVKILLCAFFISEL